jgi:hypothetical protein
MPPWPAKWDGICARHWHREAHAGRVHSADRQPAVVSSDTPGFDAELQAWLGDAR